MGKAQLLAIAGAVGVIVLLLLLPRAPQSARKAGAEAMSPMRIKLNEAIALVNGQDPMRGITMLRELAEEDPTNAEVHWHLGLFSVQSGQLARAIDRFKRVIELDEEAFPDAWGMLGQCYAMSDSVQLAIHALERYRDLSSDPEAIASTDRALETLKNTKEEDQNALRKEAEAP